MGKSHDKLANRLAIILIKLNSGERFSVKDLAKEFSVDNRTIQRDLKRLDYLPLKKENNEYFLEEYYLGKLNYDDIKNFARLSGIKSLYPDMSDSFILDILNQKVNKAFLVKNNGFEDASKNYKEFEFLSEAILNSKQVEFIYKDKKRIVEPYKLINNKGIWYLLANEDDNLKNYTLSKIQTVRTLDNQSFVPKQAFLDRIAQNESNWFSNVQIEVILDINNKVKEYFLKQDYLPNKTVYDIKEESILLKTIVSYDEEIINLCMQWLPHIRIVSPIHIQEKLENILKEYLQTTQPVLDSCHTSKKNLGV